MKAVTSEGRSSVARKDPVLDWLLEPDNPPVRYLTLTQLMGKPATDPEVRRAGERRMDYAVTQEILRRWSEYAEDDDRAYWKYTGKYWQLIFLGKFLADGQHPRIAQLAENILATRKWINPSGGQCLTANLLAALDSLGYGEHPVVKQEREALAGRINSAAGIQCHVMDYSLLPRCYMAQPKLLLCFARVAPRERSPALRSAIKLLAGNLVENQVFMYVPGNRKQWQAILQRQPKSADLPKGRTVKQWVAGQRERFMAQRGLGEGEPKAVWLKFGFPLHYNSDLLEAVYALAQAGVAYSSRLEKPLQAIAFKQTPDGKWILENSLNGKMLADVEVQGQPSKWLTYFARCVLKWLGVSEGRPEGVPGVGRRKAL